MFGMSLFTRTKKTRQVSRSYRPWADELETRLCPDGSGPALSIITLNTEVLAGHQVRLTGEVMGQSGNEGFVVTFTGTVSGTTTTDAFGCYSYTTDAASLGAVYAVGVKDWENTYVVDAQIAVEAPVIDFGVAWGSQDTVTITGTLTDLDAGGRIVTISGVVDGTVVTDSQGNFSYTGAALGLGEIEVSAESLWGLTALDDAMLSSDPPEITSFTWVNGFANVYTFSGMVTGEYVAGLTVRLGGIPSLEGQTATVQADGSFQITLFLGENENGTATAIVANWWGLDSNELWSAVG